MAHWTEDLHELCEQITDEISEATKKLNKNGGKMTAGDLDYIDKLTHALKSIKTVIAMEDYDEDYSGARVKRDSMGRYSKRGRSYESDIMHDDRRYSGDREELKEQLRDLERTSHDGETKRMIRDWMRQVEDHRI